MIFPAQGSDKLGVQPFRFTCFDHNPSSFLKAIDLAEPGLRIGLVQLRGGFLPAIFITLLKDADDLSRARFTLLSEWSWRLFIPLQANTNSQYHDLPREARTDFIHALFFSQPELLNLIFMAGG